jgi:carboxyl-terminal processing protease
MRHILKTSIAATIFLSLIVGDRARANTTTAPADQSQVALAVANWLQQAHYSRAKLDDAMSSKLLVNYLELLDYNKLYFTGEDIAEFTEKYATSLDDRILRGDLEPAHEIFARYKQRTRQEILRF